MKKIVLLQIVATIGVAVVSALLGGESAALSAFLAGLACLVPNALFALNLSVFVKLSPSYSPLFFFIGEFVKIIAIVLFLFGTSNPRINMAAEALTATEYITHHLHHLSTTEQSSIIDFSVLNMDTIVFSILMMACALYLMYKGAKKATSGVPGKWQCAVEMLVEFVNEQAKSIVHGDRTFIAPLALTVFVWVVLMNAIDLIPVDLLPTIAGWLGIHYLRPLPTADLNGTMGISVGVLFLMIYYGIKIKGVGGFSRELFVAPFGNYPLLWPFNFALNIIEYLAKCVSLGMRLFGNMYAGELLFFLIALLGSLWVGFDGLSIFGVFGHAVAGICWWLFHVLIVILQAFIMMMLTLVYIGQAHEGH